MTNQMPDNPTIAIIVAAGSSSRMGGGLPKPYMKLGERMVLAHVLEIFTSHPGIDGVRVVINRAHHPLYKKAAAGFSLFPPVVGGDRRQDSVRIGLDAVARAKPGKVLIHDAARPLVDHALIDRVLAGLDESPAALPYTPVVDSIHHITLPPASSTGSPMGRSSGLGRSADLASCTMQGYDGITPLDRSQLVAAQTPQGFDFNRIYKAHLQFSDEDVTDDIALAEKAGLAVKLTLGSERNVKLTTANQLQMLEYMMANDEQEARSAGRITSSHRRTKNRKEAPIRDDSLQSISVSVAPSASARHESSVEAETRVGSGFDVHAFEPHADGTAEADQVVHLCGLKIPHTQKLKGHSDADVALHAVVDALLGTICEGDIGEHFPPSDPKWKGANSSQFIEHACELLAQKNGEITHVDLTIIGERPKISEHRGAMRQQLASLLGVDVRRVSIKATTTEKLGFLGRGEGLAAQATATVKVPVL